MENPTGKEVLASLDLKNGASQIAKMLIEDCTHLYLYIGQSINPAHQNPDLPFDLSIKNDYPRRVIFTYDKARKGS